MPETMLCIYVAISFPPGAQKYHISKAPCIEEGHRLVLTSRMRGEVVLPL